MSSFNWREEAENQWDNRASYWHKRSKNMWDNGSRKEIIPFIKKHLHSNGKILDVGCGDGYGSLKLQQAGLDVVGIDLSTEMITKAREKVKSVDFLQADVCNLPFDSSVFDGMMAINVLEWIENPSVALNELGRVLVEGGLLCVGILGPTAGPRASDYPKVFGKKTICNTMMPWEFLKMAKELNFDYVDGFGVYKKEVKESHVSGLPLELKQALSFMWVFMLKKGVNKNET